MHAPIEPNRRQQTPSRAQTLKQALCAAVVVPESLELLQERGWDWIRALCPQNEGQGWLCDQVALLSVRIDRLERIERRIRDKISLRAELVWDHDRKLDAERLGTRIQSQPAEVVEALRRTPHGCDWLMSRWALLAHVADVNQTWTPEQTRLAFDLLGTPVEFRDGRKPGTLLDIDGRVLEPAQDLAAVARREINALKIRREAARDLDDVDRSLTEADLIDGTDPELKSLRSYERSLHQRLRWCLAQLRLKPEKIVPNATLRPRWIARPEPEVVEPIVAQNQMVSPHPPFDLEPDECPEPGQIADIPGILARREAKRRAQAEALRNDRRRKLERLRA